MDLSQLSAASGDAAPTRRPTMNDVAAHLGVSRQLVSLVMRDRPGASAETRQRVREAADHLGYSPDLTAQKLRQNGRKHLGIVFALNEVASAEVVEHMQTAASGRGYTVALSGRSPRRGEREAVDELLGYRCDALIIVSPLMAEADLARLARRVPVVSVGYRSDRDGYDTVHSAGDTGIQQAVSHLVELGHRDIAYVDGLGMPDSSLRRQGYLTGIDSHGLVPDVVTIDGVGYVEEAGALAAGVLLGRPRLPTAVVASNDHEALGLMGSMLRAGVSIPADLSVTGYDDSRLARLSFLDLTSVRQEPAQLGDTAVDCALSRIDGRRETSEHITSAGLIVRSSTAPPRQAAT